MKFFKKPAVAILLALIIVAASTLISVDIRFGSSCQKVIDGFYDGVYDDEGYTQNSIASHLKNILGCVDGMITIANNYDIDTEDASYASDDLKLGFRYSENEISYLYYCYDELMSCEMELEDALSRAPLSQRDAEGFEQYKSKIAGAVGAIEKSGYNESVREFLREEMHFPADFLARLVNIQLPEYFA